MMSFQLRPILERLYKAYEDKDDRVEWHVTHADDIRYHTSNFPDAVRAVTPECEVTLTIHGWVRAFVKSHDNVIIGYANGRPSDEVKRLLKVIAADYGYPVQAHTDFGLTDHHVDVVLLEYLKREGIGDGHDTGGSDDN